MQVLDVASPALRAWGFGADDTVMPLIIDVPWVQKQLKRLHVFDILDLCKICFSLEAISYNLLLNNSCQNNGLEFRIQIQKNCRKNLFHNLRCTFARS